MVSDAPFTVEECSVGTGATCGSIYLDRGFESLLKRRFGKSWERVLTPKKLAQLVRYFDSTIKREFNPLDPSSDTEFEIPIAGVGDMEWIGLKDGYLRLSKFLLVDLRKTDDIEMTSKASLLQSLIRFWHLSLTKSAQWQNATGEK